MPPRFTVVSQPVEEAVAKGIAEGLSAALASALALSEVGEQAIAHVSSDYFLSRLARVSFEAVLPGSLPFLFLALAGAVWGAHALAVYTIAGKIMKRDAHLHID